MVMSSVRVLGYVLFAIHMMYLVVNIVGVAWGIYLLDRLEKYNGIFGTLYLMPGLVGIIVSSFGILMAILNIMNLLIPRKCLVYASTMFMVFMLAVRGIAIGLAVYLMDHSSEWAYTALVGSFTTDNLKAWNDLQEDYKCCGIYNYTTWTSSPYRVPESCCPGVCDSTKYFKDDPVTTAASTVVTTLSTLAPTTHVTAHIVSLITSLTSTTTTVLPHLSGIYYHGCYLAFQDWAHETGLLVVIVCSISLFLYLFGSVLTLVFKRMFVKISV